MDRSSVVCSVSLPRLQFSLTVVYWPLGRVCSHFLCLQCYPLKNSLTSGAFVGALVIGLALHYKDLVATDFYEYPQEWFPSVSASIGCSSDTCGLISGNFYPERSVFHIFVALCSGPRFALVLLWYLLSCERESRISRPLIIIGLLQTLLFGVWAYVTSTEDIVIHEISGIGYLFCSLPWTLGIISIAPRNPRAQRYRKVIAGFLYAMWLPMILFFVLHKREVPGGVSSPKWD